MCLWIVECQCNNSLYDTSIIGDSCFHNLYLCYLEFLYYGAFGFLFSAFLLNMSWQTEKSDLVPLFLRIFTSSVIRMTCNCRKGRMAFLSTSSVRHLFTSYC